MRARTTCATHIGFWMFAAHHPYTSGLYPRPFLAKGKYGSGYEPDSGHLSEKTQSSSNLISIALGMVALALGYHVISNSFSNPRPAPLEPGSAGQQESRKVEFRLWQDPFEPFEPSTNQASSASSEPDSAGSVPWLSLRGQAFDVSYRMDLNSVNTTKPPADDCSLSNDIATHLKDTSNAPTAILGVMLDGSSYAEDKEVRLRLRYAVELAFLTAELGPEDLTHISTNSITLDGKHPNNLSYEWFKSRSDSGFRRALVLWLNESDFEDNPAQKLDSLIQQIPCVRDPAKNACFFLIGPHSSDTLRALTGSLNDSATNLISAARTGRFKILSPEATAVDQTWLEQKFSSKLGNTNVFYNWIASDQQLGDLIAQELANRMVLGPMSRLTNRVVVILNEQDTYFGSHLADEWINSLVARQICQTGSNVWKFAYLRGLDGSKPASKKSSKKTADLPTSPEEALQTIEQQQQQEGLKADGNAQMDYIARLGEFLRKKDLEMKEEGTGRIIAVGLTGSDTYDKLILLQEISHRLPEAVFFTTDLDAPLWTRNLLPFSSNLLVASASPIDPDSKNNNWPLLEEFPPFRDVYQAGVYHACNAVVTNLWGTNLLCEAKYDAPNELLKGTLWKIGRHGPVPLKPSVEKSPQDAKTNGEGRHGFFGRAFGLLGPWWNMTPGFGLLALGLIAFRLRTSSHLGANLPFLRSTTLPAPASDEKNPVQEAESHARRHQLSLFGVLGWIIGPLLAGSLIWAFLYTAWKISQLPGEEPWDFVDGVSIWPSEFLRLIIICASPLFLWWLYSRLKSHRQRLWKRYFAPKYEDECTDADWNAYWNERQKTWGKSRLFSRADSLMAGWIPVFRETSIDDKAEAAVDMQNLFEYYLRLGRFGLRLRRALISAILYFAVAASLVSSLHDTPTWLLVRGNWSHAVDRWVLLVTVIMILTVLFYMLDAALLSKRVLNCIGMYPTSWPDRQLLERAADFSVKREHLEGLFDVEFAAIHTQEIGYRMFGPFVLLLLLVLSRWPYFDNWTWPLGLVIIIVANFVLGIVCWWVVRDAAKKARQFALNRLDLAKSSVKSSTSQTINVLTSSRNIEVSKKKYLKNLQSVQNAILNENRGAYANAFQDPSYLGVCIPSGLSGLIPLITWSLDR